MHVDWFNFWSIYLFCVRDFHCFRRGFFYRFIALSKYSVLHAHTFFGGLCEYVLWKSGSIFIYFVCKSEVKQTIHTINIAHNQGIRWNFNPMNWTHIFIRRRKMSTVWTQKKWMYMTKLSVKRGISLSAYNCFPSKWWRYGFSTAFLVDIHIRK